MKSWRIWLVVGAISAVTTVACSEPPVASGIDNVKDDTAAKKKKKADTDTKAKPPSPADVQAIANPPISPSSPKLDAMSPTSTTANGATVDITITGTQFDAEAMIGFGDQSLKPLTASKTQLTARVPANLLGSAATLPVKVLNPPAKGGTSNALSFTVTSLAASVRLDNINPASAPQGGAREITLAVSGSGFTQNSRVRFNGTDLRTTFRSAAALEAFVPVALTRLASSVSVTVFDPQGNQLTAPRPFQVLRTATGTGSSAGSGTVSACEFTCAEYGYASGQCYQDFTCKNGCLAAGKCAAEPACKYRCSTYDYVAGECVGDWECRNDGCLVPKTCGTKATGTSAGTGAAATTCEYPCNEPYGAWSYAVGECKENYECGADSCLRPKVCTTAAATATAASCKYACSDPYGAWSYAPGECNAGYECQSDGCLVEKTCSTGSTGTTRGATCEYACSDPSGAWSYAAGECSGGYECQSDGCLHQKVCPTAGSGTTGGDTGSSTASACTYPCNDPFGAYSYAENECSAGYCCSQGCLYDEASFFGGF